MRVGERANETKLARDRQRDPRRGGHAPAPAAFYREPVTSGIECALIPEYQSVQLV